MIKVYCYSRCTTCKKALKWLDENEMYALLATDGMLVKRPLLVTDDTAIPGFREETWKDALTSLS